MQHTLTIEQVNEFLNNFKQCVNERTGNKRWFNEDHIGTSYIQHKYVIDDEQLFLDELVKFVTSSIPKPTVAKKKAKKKVAKKKVVKNEK